MAYRWFVALSIAFAIFPWQSPRATELTFGCGAVGQEFELCKSLADEWAKKTGNTVRTHGVSRNASERLGIFLQAFEMHSDFFDVIQVDVVWPGMLAPHLLDLTPYTKGVEREFFPRILANNTYRGKLIALPWHADAGMLYYREDLLKKYNVPVPTTWDELTASAKKIMKGERAGGNDRFWGYVWQGDEYEGLTCNALEWIASFNGGAIVEPNGTVSVNNANAVKALKLATSWVGTITPSTVLRSKEEDARRLFQEGNAAFMRNWPYAWSLAQAADSKIKGKVGVAPLPEGDVSDGRHAATLGGQQLAVSRYSRNKELAADLALYLSNAMSQKQRALRGSFSPTRPILYQDPDLRRASPQLASLLSVYDNAVARPSTVTGAAYDRVSLTFYTAVFDVISRRAAPEEALKQLETALNRLRGERKW